LAVGGAGGWLGHARLAPANGAVDLAEAALTAHGTYVVEVIHPVEVPATQREHLDTWMSKRMGTQMRPPDLAASGFSLMGGRILPSEDGPAGLYMYENEDGKRITLYISPQRNKADSAFEYAGEGTTQSLYWKDRGLGYAVVGDMPRDRLRDLAKQAYDQLL
ncbi:MAG: anti-sigma factor family protein, partial [Paracoccaceae bacterium]